MSMRATEPGSIADDVGGGTDRSDIERTLTETIELFFFAYRDFTGEADQRLADKGFGRAHHRVLYFVNRYPGLPVADLLDILKITKQSLARVLRQLVEDGYIAQEQGATDRRQRLLYPTARGSELARALTDLQMRRVEKAMRSAGDGGTAAIRAFLSGMISEPDRERVLALLSSPRTARPVVNGPTGG